jgi:hypothetical protein
MSSVILLVSGRVPARRYSKIVSTENQCSSCIWNRDKLKGVPINSHGRIMVRIVTKFVTKIYLRLTIILQGVYLNP